MVWTMTYWCGPLGGLGKNSDARHPASEDLKRVVTKTVGLGYHL